MKIYIETYGCSANQNNSEIMAGLLLESKYGIVDSEDEADLIILNTCIVKGPTESKEIARIKRIAAGKKKLVVAGCMSQVAERKIRKISDRIAILGIDNITEVVRIVDLLERGEARVFTEKKREVKLGNPKLNKNPVISIIQIAEGCLGNCAYCSVKFAKGHLHSYPIRQIIDEAKESVASGMKEIWLTSQDNSAYGLDMGHTLIDLLDEIVKIEGDFKIRIGRWHGKSTWRYRALSYRK